MRKKLTQPLIRLKKMCFHHIKGPLLLIVVTALTVRVIFFYQSLSLPFGGEKVSGGDAQYYLNWANRLISHGDPFPDAFFMSPLYPYFLAIIFTVFGVKLWVVRLIQHILGLFTIILVYKIGTALKDRTTGILAATLLLGYGPALFYEGFLLLATLLLFLNTLALYLLFHFRDTNRKDLIMGCFLPGLLWGVASIGRGLMLLFIPVVLLFYYFDGKKYEKDVKRRVLLFLVGFVTAMSPVWLRNYHKTEKLGLVTTNLGLNFYIGNNPHSKGVYDLPQAIRFIPGKLEEDIEGKRYAEKKTGRKLSSAETSQFWLQRGVRFWRQYPLKAILNYGRKLRLFFNAWEIPQIENYYFYRNIYLKVLRVTSIPFALIAILALASITLPKPSYGVRALQLFCALYWLGISLFFITARYRIPLLSFLVLLAAHLARSVYLETMKKKVNRPLISTLAVSFITACLIFGQPFDMNYTLAQQYNQLGFMFFREGKLSEAAKYYIKACKQDSTFATANRNLADVYQLMGRQSLAEQYYLKAISLPPPEAVTYYNLALLYQQKKDLEAAMKNYQKAVTLDPQFSEAFLNMAVISQQRNKLKEALLLYQKALEADPHNDKAYNNMGNLLLKLGLTKDALTFFKRASQENPKDIRYQINYAVSLFTAGDQEQGLTQLIQLAKKPHIQASEEKFEKVLIPLIRMAQQAGKKKKIAAIVRDFLVRFPQNHTLPEVWLNKSKSSSKSDPHTGK